MKNKLVIILLCLIFLILLPGCSRTDVNNIPVFLYHAIKPELEEGEDPGMVVKADNFEEDLKYLKDNGYTAIDLQALIAACNDPEAKLPPKPVVLTFDDGYLNNYEYAYPLLQKYDTKASMFIIVWSVGRDKCLFNDTPINPHFTWEQGKEMANSGLIELGSHSFDLHNPKGLSYGYEAPCGQGLAMMGSENEGDYYERIFKDLERSKTVMEENLGTTVNTFAYPYGIYNDTVIQILKNLEFELAFITESEVPSKSCFEIKRITVRDNLRVSEILEKDK